MIGSLSQNEIEHLLRTRPIGRLGLCNGAQVFVFPIAIGYDGISIFGVSREGMKIGLMRRFPEVCVEVEDITSPAHWKTVLAHGRFEEVTDPEERERALECIAMQGDAVTPLSLAPYLDGPEALVVWRVLITSTTGRYERDEVFPERTLVASGWSRR